MVEQLPQASKGRSRGELSAITPGIFVQTGSSRVAGSVSLGDSQRRQSAGLALQASIFLASQRRTRWCRERSDKIDAFRCS